MTLRQHVLPIPSPVRTLLAQCLTIASPFWLTSAAPRWLRAPRFARTFFTRRLRFAALFRAQASGKSMEYYDEERKEKYVPHVIEPSFGDQRCPADASALTHVIQRRMAARAHACTHERAWVCTRAHTRACANVHSSARARTHARTHARTARTARAHTRTHARTPHVHQCALARTRTHARARAHMSTHARTRARTAQHSTHARTHACFCSHTFTRGRGK
eukprot:6192980-Pleurochrysis_carterae.AAC.1